MNMRDHGWVKTDTNKRCYTGTGQGGLGGGASRDQVVALAERKSTGLSVRRSEVTGTDERRHLSHKSRLNEVCPV